MDGVALRVRMAPGSLLAATLPLDCVVLGDGDEPVRRQGEHRLWVVATQECDLVAADADDQEASIELRPVYTDDPPDDWGIRSFQFLLTETEYVVSLSPRTMLSPAVLTALVARGSMRRDPASSSAVARSRSGSGFATTDLRCRTRWCPLRVVSRRR